MGRVYFFRETGRKYVKIGMTRSDSVHKRFKTFKMYAACGAYVVGSIKTKTPKQLESKIHSAYSFCRAQGEFFALSDEQVKVIIDCYEGGEIPSHRHDLIRSKSKKIIQSLKGKQLTNSEIKKHLESKGISITHTSLGLMLKEFGYTKTPKRRNKTVSQIYQL